MTRLRVVQFVIQPVIVADDGDTLAPVQAQPITITSAQLDGFAEQFRADLAEQEERLNADD